MTTGKIHASLTDPGDLLDPRFAQTVTVTATFANDIIAALNNAEYTYDDTKPYSQRLEFQGKVRAEIQKLLSDSEQIYEWWMEVNGSKPKGKIWEYDPNHYFSHPRRRNLLIAVHVDVQYRYLDIHTEYLSGALAEDSRA